MKAIDADVDKARSTGDDNGETTFNGELTSSSWAAAVVASYNDGSDNDSILLTNSGQPSHEKSRSTSGSTMASEDNKPPASPGGRVADGGEDEEKKTEAPAAPQQHPPTPSTPRHENLTVPPPPPPGGSSSSPKSSSPFRRSLDMEARAKDRQRRVASESSSNSKQLLRDSIQSLSVRVDDYGQSVLTRPERNFLEMLLQSDGPGAAEACMAAHQRLMDGNLFWAVCGGSAGEVGSLIPGHGWSVNGSAHSMGIPMESMESLVKLKEETDGGGGGGGGNTKWMDDWVSRGSQSSNDSGGDNKKEKTKEEKIEGDKKQGSKSIAFSPAVGRVSTKKEDADAEKKMHRSYHSLAGGASLSSSARELLRPFDLQRRSSEARLSRLEQRRRQSSLGKDSTSRLFKAHEAGLVVTPHGSARRSLMRMGLPMEKGLYAAAPQPSPHPLASKDLSKELKLERQELLNAPSLPLEPAKKDAGVDEDRNSTILACDTNLEHTLERTTFEKALAKMDERTIRRIEKEERAKRKALEEAEDRMTTVSDMKSPLMMGGAGCDAISPFSMSILRKMFASKQFSFHRNSSSYTRFDSFLNSQTTESGGLRTSESGILSDSTGLNSAEVNDIKRDIFRPSPRASSAEERLKNLLVNAGFQNAGEDGDEDGQGQVVEARTEDDADIMSTSNDSVAMLLKGGPSFKDADMFRGERPDEVATPEKTKSADSKKTPVRNNLSGVKKVNLAIQTTVGSAVSSLGSPPRGGNLASDVERSPGNESKVSPTNSDLGELPALPTIQRGLSQSAHSSSRPSRSVRHKRSTTVGGVLKSSSHSTNTSPSRNNRGKRGYKRSVSWGHMVFSKEEVRSSVMSVMSRQDSTSTSGTGLSVISFPNLRRAVPLRSDSIGSHASTLLSYPPPLKLSVPLRSESVGSVASVLSPIPSLSRAHPVFSPRPSFSSTAASTLTPQQPPPLVRAHSVHSQAQSTVVVDDLLDECSLNSEEYTDAKPAARGAAWESPLVSKAKGKRFPLHDRGLSSSTGAGDGEEEERAHPPKMFIRQASENNYGGMGIEVEEILPEVECIDHARKYRSMVSLSDYSAVLDSGHSSRNLDRSHRSQRSSSGFGSSGSKNFIGPPAMQTLDDSFIIKNINFERHSSEMLRSLSNEDLYSTHHLETIFGGSSKGVKDFTELSSVARVIGDPLHDSSWDIDSVNSCNLAVGPSGGVPAPGVNAWGVLEDEYAEGYGADDTLPFRILGTSANDTDCHPHVLSPPLMESLQNFMPPTISENNFWLKYSLVRDGASLPSLLRHIRGTKHALIAIETVEGEVFGSFTSSPWRKNWNYYGSGESFLWRMRRTRSERDAQFSVLDQAKLESELDVFYWTGRNDLVQYCTHEMLAVGGGPLVDDTDARDDITGEQRELPPTSAAFSHAADKGGFGLAIDAELLRGTSSPCATFHSPPLSHIHVNGSPFEILNVEVWTMTPCANMADAENMEMKKLFLDAYSQDM